jgi:hypothetical protein
MFDNKKKRAMQTMNELPRRKQRGIQPKEIKKLRLLNCWMMCAAAELTGYFSRVGRAVFPRARLFVICLNCINSVLLFQGFGCILEKISR